jgi:hypothetical protein
MRIVKSLGVTASTLLTLLLFAQAKPATAQAQTPAYMHAISDLRSARTYLQMDTRPQFADIEHHAINDISKAIDEMQKAAYRDGKDIWQPPPPQSGGDINMPVHSAVRLLREARNDVSQGYDLPENHGLRERSAQHIQDALDHLKPLL